MPDSALSTPHQAAEGWLWSRINYERTPQVPYHQRQLKLDRMRQLLAALGNPERVAPIIHIAGTKGKGSTAAMIAGMLTAADYKTGVYSSPHVERIEERFAIDGQPCTGDDLVALVTAIRPIIEQFDHQAAAAGDEGPTFFDITTAMALMHFAQQACTAVVLEVGLGGRLDSTNVCQPEVCVITSISLDHTHLLGNTLASIAREKAGILKTGVPVVCGVVEPEPQQVIADLAMERACRRIQLGRDFYIENYRRVDNHNRAHPPSHSFDYLELSDVQWNDIELAMAGRHQAANAALALAVRQELVAQGWRLPETACRQGLATVRLPGRLEWFPRTPPVILDTAHNEASARALVATLEEEFPSAPRTLVVACSQDKDVPAIAAQLAPAFERIAVTCYQQNARSVPAERLLETFRQVLGPPHETTTQLQNFPTPGEALAWAEEATPPEGMICVAGSFFLAAELRRLL